MVLINFRFTLFSSRILEFWHPIRVLPAQTRHHGGSVDDRLTIKLGVVIQKVRHEDWSVFSAGDDQRKMIILPLIPATASGKIVWQTHVAKLS